MADQLEALLLLNAGQTDAALAMLEQAAAAEDAMSFDFGPPSPVKPAHELYGEVLLDLNRPAEAQAQYTLALERTPKRAQALLGLARAATQAGDDATAQHAYADLHTIWHSADEDLTALQEVSTILGEAR
jgi:tetratricopeptide (TPR) repeat protein